MKIQKWARKIAQTVYRPGKDYPIPFGPLRGLRMVYSPSSQFHFMLGLYDLALVKTVDRVLRGTDSLKPGFVACDLGANVGYFSLWLSRLAQEAGGGKVYSFEPELSNIEQIQKNLEINGFSTTGVENGVVSDTTGSIAFFKGETLANGSLVVEWAGGGTKNESQMQQVQVRSTTLDDFFFTSPNRGPSPDFIKIDIEGAGNVALAHMKKCLTVKRPLVLIESHIQSEDAAISKLVQEMDYQAYRFSPSEWVEDRTARYPNLKGIWGTMLLVPEEKVDQVQPLLPKTQPLTRLHFATPRSVAR